MSEVSVLVEQIVSSIVDEVEKIEIVEVEQPNGLLYEITVSKEDIGKLIGKEGRVASALRTIVKASGAKHGVKVLVNVMNTPNQK